MKNLFFILIVVSALSFTSCATLVHSSKQKVTINSTPTEAKVYLNLNEVGKTGDEIKVKRCDLDKLVTVKKDGYEDYAFEFELSENPIAFLDALAIMIPWIGALPYVINQTTCAGTKTKKEYNVTLTK